MWKNAKEHVFLINKPHLKKTRVFQRNVYESLIAGAVEELIL